MALATAEFALCKGESLVRFRVKRTQVCITEWRGSRWVSQKWVGIEEARRQWARLLKLGYGRW